MSGAGTLHLSSLQQLQTAVAGVLAALAGAGQPLLMVHAGIASTSRLNSSLRHLWPIVLPLLAVW